MVRCESNLKYENIYGILKKIFLVAIGVGGGGILKNICGLIFCFILI